MHLPEMERMGMLRSNRGHAAFRGYYQPRFVTGKWAHIVMFAFMLAPV